MARSHVLLILMRLVLAVGIAAALPLAHVWWGHSSEGAGIDGQEAFGFLIVFVLIGLGFAAGFLVLASLGHLLLRRRPRAVWWIDLGLGLSVMLVLVWGGVTATYTATP